MSNEVPPPPPPPPGPAASGAHNDASAGQPPKLKLQPRAATGTPLPPPPAAGIPLPPPPVAAPKPVAAPTVRPAANLSPTTGAGANEPIGGAVVALDILTAVASLGCAVFLALELFSKTKV